MRRKEREIKDPEIINDREDKKQGLDIIMQQHGKMKNSYVDKAVDKMAVLKVNIENLTGKQGGSW